MVHDQRTDPRIRSLSERVEVIGDDETNKTYPDLYRSIIDVELKNGARHLRDITYPKGSPENPVRHDVLEKKFVRLTQDVLSPSRANEIGTMIARMEEIDDIGQFTRLLAR
jgi:2-methylcitrate dehydratase PrpD